MRERATKELQREEGGKGEKLQKEGGRKEGGKDWKGEGREEERGMEALERTVERKGGKGERSSNR